MASVLLVEDDEGYRAALRKLITLCFPGTQVVEAEDGATALSITRLISFDAIILDYYLHAMGGGDVARYLRQRVSAGGRKTPIILTSSQPDVELFTRVLGASAFLHKPCKAEQLAALLGPLLKSEG